MATLYGSIGGSPPPWEDSPSVTDQVQDFLSKVAAHIPSEVVSIFLLGKAIAGDEPQTVGIWAVVCWIIAAILRWFGTQGAGKLLNFGLSVLAFPVWVMAIGGTILGFTFAGVWPTLIALAFAVVAGFVYNNK